MSKLLLAYWDLRGFAEPSRLLLEYCGVDFEDKRYPFGEPPTYTPDAWFNEKYELGLDFPNLPYLFDGDVKVSESQAILKYLARKYGLAPKTEMEIHKCEMIEGVTKDMRAQFGKACYAVADQHKQLKAEFLENTLPKTLQMFDKYLEKNEWLAGSNLTYVDFYFAEYLDHFKLLGPAVVKKFANVSKFHKKFFELEKIAAYRQSKRFNLFPINGPTASWGGGKSQG